MQDDMLMVKSNSDLEKPNSQEDYSNDYQFEKSDITAQNLAVPATATGINEDEINSMSDHKNSKEKPKTNQTQRAKVNIVDKRESEPFSETTQLAQVQGVIGHRAGSGVVVDAADSEKEND